ncbi:MAG TPA: response regulator, partial [Prosthecobacter sp.]
LVTSLSQFAAAATQALALRKKSATVQHQLQEVQAKLESALEAGAIATWSWDIINNRVFADSYCAHLFSISDEDALGGPIARYIESIHPDDRERVNEAIQTSVNSSGSYEVEYRLRSKDTYRWVIARGKVLRDAAGNPTHFPGVIVDIADRKQAQIDLDERQRALWAGLPVACYTLDAEGRISFYNEAACALWGRRPALGVDMWCGAHALLSLAGEPIPLDRSPGAVAFKERRAIRGVEVHIVRPDGTRRWVAPHADPIYDPSGKFVGLINVLYDMTEERVATAALREARDQAISASRAKDDFLAALSHELRTPLNPVLLLASDAAQNTAYPAEIRADFDAIWRNVELESRLIDDLLDITRIARGKLKLDCALTDLHTVVQEAEKKVHVDARDKRLSITWDLAAPRHRVYGDPVRLQQVFWNVLKNAVKFTPCGGSIRIATTCAANGREVQVCIEDTGIGIRAEELPGIFDAFTQGSQGDEGTHVFGGLGLGLAISQQVMHLHQGRIVAHSEGEGKGACFAIEMPVAETGQEESSCPGCEADAPCDGAGADAGQPDETSDGQDQGMRILIIEDHVPSRQALQRLLTRRKHTVETAGSGEEACQKMKAASFDLIICDIGLPDTDGYVLAQELLQLQPEVPIVAMTGYGTENDIRRAEMAGFVCHLTKPVSAARLEQMLAKVDMVQT